MKAFALALSVILASTCHAQANPAVSARLEALSELRRNMPSERELSELLAKADEKVSAFEAAVKNAKPGLDKTDTKYARNYLEAAATAHLLISETIKNGPTAYRLVGVLGTLDDLSRDAAKGTVFLLIAEMDRPTPEGGTVALSLSAVGTACNDIAELIFHATMRLIAAEETALNKLLDEQK
jgi:hypothetical protein